MGDFLSFRWLSWRGVVCADAIDQVRDYSNVQEQSAKLQQCRMVVDFVDLEWYQRAGDNHAKPFGPAFRHAQSDAFGEKQPGIEKAAYAEIADFVGRQICCPDQQL